MIMLTTPIVLGSQTYNAIGIMGGRFDLQNNYAEGHLALLQVTSTQVIVGVRDLTLTPVKVRFPPPFRAMTLVQDPTETPTELQAALKVAFFDFLYTVEGVLLARKNEAGGLLSSPYQVGTSLYSPDGTLEPLGTREITLLDIEP